MGISLKLILEQINNHGSIFSQNDETSHNKQVIISNYSVLINSDRHINYKVKQALHHLLVNQYKIFSTYEPCIYQGVKNFE